MRQPRARRIGRRWQRTAGRRRFSQNSRHHRGRPDRGASGAAVYSASALGGCSALSAGPPDRWSASTPPVPFPAKRGTNVHSGKRRRASCSRLAPGGEKESATSIAPWPEAGGRDPLSRETLFRINTGDARNVLETAQPPRTSPPGRRLDGPGLAQPAWSSAPGPGVRRPHRPCARTPGSGAPRLGRSEALKPTATAWCGPCGCAAGRGG